MAVIRVSKGNFPQEKFKEFETKLNNSNQILKPAVSRLDGCLRFYAGMDPGTNSMISVSIWDSLAHAKQLDTFAPMVKLAREYVKAGVKWERPVINYLGLRGF